MPKINIFGQFSLANSLDIFSDKILSENITTHLLKKDFIECLFIAENRSLRGE